MSTRTLDAHVAEPEVDESKTDESSGTPRTRAVRNGYTTGFCGGTPINGAFITNTERFHRMCTQAGDTGMCTCPCHRGIEVWEGRAQLWADAIAGVYAAPKNRKIRKGRASDEARTPPAGSDGPESLEEALAADEVSESTKAAPRKAGAKKPVTRKTTK